MFFPLLSIQIQGDYIFSLVSQYMIFLLETFKYLQLLKKQFVLTSFSSTLNVIIQQRFIYEIKMLFLIAKMLISSHLCYLAYHNVVDEIATIGVQNTISTNVQALHLHQKNAQFLNLYLNKIIAFCFFSSAIMIVSKNLLPKFIVMAGILLWMYFGYLEQMPPSIKIMHYAQHTAILGGILYMGGCEYFIKAITLADFKTSLDEAKKTESNEEKKDKEQ